MPDRREFLRGLSGVAATAAALSAAADAAAAGRTPRGNWPQTRISGARSSRPSRSIAR